MRKARKNSKPVLVNITVTDVLYDAETLQLFIKKLGKIQKECNCHCTLNVEDYRVRI